ARFTSLVLESSSPGLKTPEERAARRRADESLACRLEAVDEGNEEDEDNQKDFTAFLEEWHRQPLFASLAGYDGLIAKLVVERVNNNPGELAKSLRGMGTGSQPSLWEELSNLRTPTLAVVGELDEKFTGIARKMSEASSPKVESFVVGGAGHNVHLEKPEEFVRLVKYALGAG
ncbi:MAG: 2-succinyl-6-hydroxy-2,4-cyclohexadiene-1-carboxylate synthase, partial [Rubrobacter sp.]